MQFIYLLLNNVEQQSLNFGTEELNDYFSEILKSIDLLLHKKQGCFSKFSKNIISLMFIF